MRKPLVLAIGAVLALAGCGSKSVADQVGEDAPADSVETTPSTTTITTTTTTTVPETAPEECTTDRRTLEVAVEAYYAQNGTYPASQDVLIGDYLRVGYDSYEVGPDGTVVRVPGVSCTNDDDSESGAASEVLTVEEFEAMLDPDEFGGPQCALEVAVIGSAAMEFEASRGRAPDDLDDLADYLTAPITLWRFDSVAEELVPAPGAPCTFPYATDEDVCNTARKTLQVASEAYFAQYGAPAPDQEALLEAGLIRESEPSFTVVDGVVEPTPGGDCSAPTTSTEPDTE